MSATVNMTGLAAPNMLRNDVNAQCENGFHIPLVNLVMWYCFWSLGRS